LPHGHGKPDVVQDIRGHFSERLGLDLILLDGGASRTNLSFKVLPTQRTTKMADILDALETDLPDTGASGAIVYCATRSATERVAEFLKQQGLAAVRYHAGLSAEEKRDIQEAFRVGDLRIIAATNAFGSIIEKRKLNIISIKFAKITILIIGAGGVNSLREGTRFRRPVS